MSSNSKILPHWPNQFRISIPPAIQICDLDGLNTIDCFNSFNPHSYHRPLDNMNLNFEWDPHKAAINLEKHGVSFEEAQTVFQDPLASLFEDQWHSVGERREIIIGHSANHRLLLVYFTERPHQVIRLFSSRLATKKERHDYETHTYF